MNQLQDKDTTLTPLSLVGSLGLFDLDVCGIKTHTTASKIIEWPEDGLKSVWSGRVWMNPPYSNPLPWMEKLSTYNNGIAIVLASTETKWFQEFILNRECAILFLAGRPKFTRLDYSPVALMRGVVLVAYGLANYKSLTASGLRGSYIEVSH